MTDTEQDPPFNILLVDDEPDLELLIRQKMRPEIRSGKYVFSFATNGVEALQVLKENPGIDMVVSDINMPQMDGLSLAGAHTNGEPGDQVHYRFCLR